MSGFSGALVAHPGPTDPPPGQVTSPGVVFERHVHWGGGRQTMGCWERVEKIARWAVVREAGSNSVEVRRFVELNRRGVVWDG